jgi:hypothetical protein
VVKIFDREIEMTSKSAPTLAEILIRFDDERDRIELEAFRIEYEKKHGPTDLTKYYTCLWPTARQEWLIENYPAEYLEGLPPFVQAYIEQKLKAAAVRGRLDDCNPVLVRMYVRRQGRMHDAQVD